MANSSSNYRFGPDRPEQTYVPHGYPERAADLGEVAMNYATAGSAARPALLLIPAQTESWWSYEAAMRLLEADFHVHAVDLRGQGRSTRTPGRYTLDNWGAAPAVLPAWLLRFAALPDEPPQNLREYDPEWARAFWTGSATAGCRPDRMLASVRVPVLFTHHFRRIDETTGALQGALSDLQANRVRTLVEGAGQRFDYRSFPQMGHSMHGQDPALYAATLREWAVALA